MFNIKPSKVNTGFTLAIAGAFILSLEVLFLRSFDGVEGFQIIFYRSISVSILFFLYISMFTKSRETIFSIRNNTKEILSGLFLGTSFFCYIFSILNSSVASSLLILSISPMFSAILSQIFLKDKLPKHIFTILVILIIGLLVIFQNSLSDSQTFGNIIALVGAFFFASSVVTSRAIGSDKIAFGGFFAGTFALSISVLCLISFNIPIFIDFKTTILICAMGFLTTGMGMLLLLSSAKYILGPYVSLIALLEVVLAPIWSLVFYSEKIRYAEIFGGILILASIFFLIGITNFNHTKK